jgi:hypothetical protein
VCQVTVAQNLFKIDFLADLAKIVVSRRGSAMGLAKNGCSGEPYSSP